MSAVATPIRPTSRATTPRKPKPVAVLRPPASARVAFGGLALYTDEPVYRLSVERYHAMIDAGLLDTEDHCELLDGALILKMPKNTPHTAGTTLLVGTVPPLLPQGWHFRSQDPIVLAESEPEPDGMIVRGVVRDYLDRRPGPADVAVVIEVSDSSLARDRGWKLNIYARAPLPVYWVENLVEHVIEVYTEPTGEGEEATYANRETFGSGETIPLILDGTEVARIAVDDLLP